MSLVDFLERMRAKPETERRSLAFWSSLVITLMVAGIWVASLGNTLSRPAESRAQLAAVGAASSTPERAGWWTESKERIKTGWKIVTKKI